MIEMPRDTDDLVGAVKAETVEIPTTTTRAANTFVISAGSFVMGAENGAWLNDLLLQTLLSFVVVVVVYCCLTSSVKNK